MAEVEVELETVEDNLMDGSREPAPLPRRLIRDYDRVRFSQG
jgi:hypothetical protein